MKSVLNVTFFKGPSHLLEGDGGRALPLILNIFHDKSVSNVDCRTSEPWGLVTGLQWSLSAAPGWGSWWRLGGGWESGGGGGQSDTHHVTQEVTQEVTKEVTEKETSSGRRTGGPVHLFSNNTNPHLLPQRLLQRLLLHLLLLLHLPPAPPHQHQQPRQVTKELTLTGPPWHTQSSSLSLSQAVTTWHPAPCLPPSVRRSSGGRRSSTTRSTTTPTTSSLS